MQVKDDEDVERRETYAEDQRQSEEKLRAEHTFRETIEASIPSGIAVVDLHGRQTYVNPGFCAMVGRAEAELVGAWPPFIYWPPEEIKTISEAFRQSPFNS